MRYLILIFRVQFCCDHRYLITIHRYWTTTSFQKLILALIPCKKKGRVRQACLWQFKPWDQVLVKMCIVTLPKTLSFNFVCLFFFCCTNHVSTYIFLFCAFVLDCWFHLFIHSFIYYYYYYYYYYYDYYYSVENVITCPSSRGLFLFEVQFCLFYGFILD